MRSTLHSSVDLGGLDRLFAVGDWWRPLFEIACEHALCDRRGHAATSAAGVLYQHSDRNLRILHGRKRAEGSVIAMTPTEGSPKFRVNVTMKPLYSEEELRFTVGSDGDLSYLIDPAKRMVYADIDPAVAGNRGGVAKGLVMEEYTAPGPFDDELNATTVGYQGTQAVGGEDCYVIRVANKRSRESIWYFSTKDFLPRRRDTLFKNRQGETSRYTITLTDLVVGPTIDDNTFKLVVPEGFTETDEFAPDLKRRSPQ